MNILAQYHFEITYRLGKKNVLANALFKKVEDFKDQKSRRKDLRTMQVFRMLKDLLQTEYLMKVFVFNAMSAKLLAAVKTRFACQRSNKSAEDIGCVSLLTSFQNGFVVFAKATAKGKDLKPYIAFAKATATLPFQKQYEKDKKTNLFTVKEVFRLNRADLGLKAYRRRAFEKNLK